jgi:hypothetical protein
LRPVEGYYGYKVTKTVSPIIKLFEIKSNLGAFQIDNTTNNDIALNAIAASIPSISTKDLRLRCFGYIVNLIVKAMLYGDSLL